MHIEEIRSSVEALRSEIASLSEAENITPEQDARLEEALVEFEQRTAELATAEQRAARIDRVRSFAMTPGSTAPGSSLTVIPSAPSPYDADVRTLRGEELRSTALRILDDSANVRHLSDTAKEKVERLIRDLGDDHARHAIVTSRPEYRSAFTKYLNGNEGAQTAEERRAVTEVRAAGLTTTAGGYMVPETLDASVILVNDGVAAAIRRISRVETGTNNQWKGVNSAGVTASWDAEAAEVSDDAPTLAQPTVTAYKGNAFIPFSYEIGDDWANLASEALVLFADAKERLEAAAFATGNGTTAPKGIVTALDATTYAEVTPTTDGAFGAEDIFKVLNALPPRFRANASWVMGLSAMNRVRQFSTSSTGNYFTVDLTSGYGFRILGRPAYESSNFADISTLTTGASNLLVVGDFRYYLIYDKVGSSVEYIPHLFSTGSGRPTGQRGWQFWWRTGADMVSPAANPAFRLLQNQ